MMSALHPMPGVPRDTTRRIGLLGGSFNPAHEGHRHVSLEALKRLGLDEVWWLVSPQNPLKAGDGMEPLATRLARARQIGRHPHIRIEAPELALGTRYTLDTVRALRRAYPKARFVWLMGADILPQLVEWQGWRELFAAIPIAAFARPGWGYAALASTAPRAFARYRIDAEAARTLALHQPPAWCFVPSRLDSHSATAIRAVRQPRRARAKGKTIPDPVRALPDRSKDAEALLALVRRSLDDDKAEDVVVIDLKGKSAFADYMVIATGRSNRQVVAIADHVAERLKQMGHGYVPVEGKQGGDWVLVDAGDVVVHVFRPEPRAFYALEKMWALETEAAAKPRLAVRGRPRRTKKPA
jgi:ribosome silencing factor RsfS/YbeB/iojap/nicotinate (nicotinamide) nucleotide adenylyltransferase